MATPSTIHREMLEAAMSRDLERFRSLLHPEYTYIGADGVEHHGPDAGVEVLEGYLAAFPDLEFEIKNVHIQGSTAIAEAVYRGTHAGELMGIPPTGNRVESSVCNVVEVREGKVYREREYYDALSMMLQLGIAVLPGKRARA